MVLYLLHTIVQGLNYISRSFAKLHRQMSNVCRIPSVSHPNKIKHQRDCPASSPSGIPPPQGPLAGSAMSLHVNNAFLLPVKLVQKRPAPSKCTGCNIATPKQKERSQTCGALCTECERSFRVPKTKGFRGCASAVVPVARKLQYPVTLICCKACLVGLCCRVQMQARYAYIFDQSHFDVVSEAMSA